MATDVSRIDVCSPLMAQTLSLGVSALDRARISRDPRFDGKFFIAVKTTGIYCRPICPSRTSKSRNVRYYATAAAAAEAGFRPCLRCRPEAAPGTPAWLGTSAVVRRALRLIDEGMLDNASVDDLANKLGVGSRHLRRLFMQHVGASPISLAQTRRLQFAKRLLDESNLPITEIALAAGFGSLRRFNAAIQRGTPDAIDLLVVCCEAGMGLEAGIERVAQEMQKSNAAVSRVLGGLLDDLRMLPDRRDAFSNLANRSTCEGLRRFGTMLNQSLQYGTPLGEALRAIAEELRRDRITRLEERAHKLGAKLILPMVIFMLPAMFVILGGGPGLDLLHSLRGIG